VYQSHKNDLPTKESRNVEVRSAKYVALGT